MFPNKQTPHTYRNVISLTGRCSGLLYEAGGTAKSGLHKGEREGRQETFGHGLCHFSEWVHGCYVSAFTRGKNKSACTCNLFFLNDTLHGSWLYLLSCLPLIWISALRVLKDFNACKCQGCHCRRNPKSSQFSSKLHTHNWTITYAPDPQNVYW